MVSNVMSTWQPRSGLIMPTDEAIGPCGRRPHLEWTCGIPNTRANSTARRVDRSPVTEAPRRPGGPSPHSANAAQTNVLSSDELLEARNPPSPISLYGTGSRRFDFPRRNGGRFGFPHRTEYLAPLTYHRTNVRPLTPDIAAQLTPSPRAVGICFILST
ncbi:hypothetical protein R1flu_004775 [Riccia fluitans]|uniref:Uncharacterized protein n=1 Tax=Riccia fluitans TaxID=41844 RepID=A0ABD1YR91_9MARC